MSLILYMSSPTRNLSLSWREQKFYWKDEWNEVAHTHTHTYTLNCISKARRRRWVLQRTAWTTDDEAEEMPLNRQDKLLLLAITLSTEVMVDFDRCWMCWMCTWSFFFIFSHLELFSSDIFNLFILWFLSCTRFYILY